MPEQNGQYLTSVFLKGIVSQVDSNVNEISSKRGKLVLGKQLVKKCGTEKALPNLMI